jgi:hypothetical protein
MDVVKKNILEMYIMYHQNTVKAGCEVGLFTEWQQHIVHVPVFCVHLTVL